MEPIEWARHANTVKQHDRWRVRTRSGIANADLGSVGEGQLGGVDRGEIGGHGGYRLRAARNAAPAKNGNRASAVGVPPAEFTT